MKLKILKRELNVSFRKKGILERLERMVNRSMYAFLKWGGETFLKRDDKLEEYIKNGYELCPTLFSIQNRLASMFSQIKFIAYKNGEVSDVDPYRDMFKKNKSDFTIDEHEKIWYLSNLNFGECITYIPKYDKSGPDRGRPMFMRILPAQYTEIKPIDDEPVGLYILETDAKSAEYKPEDIWHYRMYHNLNTEEGINFRGLSPIKVAADRINTLISGNKILSKTLERGAPMGLLTNTSDDEQMSDEFRHDLESEWIRRYAGEENYGIPIFGEGKLSWTPIGFSSLRDLMIIENSQDGMRVLCSVYGISEELMNAQGSTYVNKPNAEKAAYMDKTIPDAEAYAEGLTREFAAWGIEYKAEYSHIAALQEDKNKLAEAYKKGIDTRSISRNEMRVDVFGKEPLDIPGMELEDMLLEDQLRPEEEVDKNLKGINDYE